MKIKNKKIEWCRAHKRHANFLEYISLMSEAEIGFAKENRSFYIFL